jgi:hypothetical protein
MWVACGVRWRVWEVRVMSSESIARKEVSEQNEKIGMPLRYLLYEMKLLVITE